MFHSNFLSLLKCFRLETAVAFGQFILIITCQWNHFKIQSSYHFFDYCYHYLYLILSDTNIKRLNSKHHVQSINIIGWTFAAFKSFSFFA